MSSDNRRSYRMNEVFEHLRPRSRATVDRIDAAVDAIYTAVVNDGVIDEREVLPILQHLQRARRNGADADAILTEWDTPNAERGMELAQREVERQQRRDRQL